MKSFRERNPYAIGISSVLVLGALVGIAFMVGILHLLEHTYGVKAVFNDAAGIRSGADVRVAGIKAGRVTGVEADRQQGKVIIKFVVNKGVHLGPDTRAEVALETLLGTKFLRLSGPVHKPYLEDLPTAQRVIPNDRTKTPFDIFDLTKIATRSVQATDTTKLNQFITDLADITQGKHDQITQLLEGLSRVSTAVNDLDAQLRQLLDRRVQKTDSSGTVLYHYDPTGRLISETDGAGGKLRVYIYLAGRLIVVDGCVSATTPGNSSDGDRT